MKNLNLKISFVMKSPKWGEIFFFVQKNVASSLLRIGRTVYVFPSRCFLDHEKSKIVGPLIDCSGFREGRKKNVRKRKKKKIAISLAAGPDYLNFFPFFSSSSKVVFFKAASSQSMR